MDLSELVVYGSERIGNPSVDLVSKVASLRFADNSNSIGLICNKGGELRADGAIRTGSDEGQHRECCTNARYN